MICLDIAVGQPDIFRQGNDFDQMLKFLTLLTVGVQLILDSLEVVVFRMTKFRFLLSLVFCCHSRPLSFRIRPFLVLLEPMEFV